MHRKNTKLLNCQVNLDRRRPTASSSFTAFSIVAMLEGITGILGTGNCSLLKTTSTGSIYHFLEYLAIL